METATSDAADLLTLEVPTVVTASRYEQKITSVPYAMSVVTAEDIRWAGARSVPEALRLVPGVDVAQLTYGNWAVSPRASHSVYADKTLVLVDGRQIFDTIFGGTAWGNWPFQIEDIDRIEVVRGPGGVTWGANAVNGVINIITKDPGEQKGLTLRGGGGSRGTTKDYSGYGFSDGKLRMRVSSEYERSDGYKDGGGFRIGPLDDEYAAGRGSVHAIYDINPQQTLTLSGGSTVVDGNYPVPMIQRLDPHKDSAQGNFILGKWTNRLAPDSTLSITGYVNDYYSAASVGWSEYRYQQLALQIGHTFKPADNHQLTWGLDGRADMTNAGMADPFMLSKDFVGTGTIAPYIQDDWQFAPRWTLSLGARVDYEFYGGFQPSGRAALSYELNKDSQVYAAISRAFQMPPAALRFEDFPLATRAFRLSSVRDLDAQPLNAYEIGYRGKPFDKLDLALNSFWHDYHDLLAGNFAIGPPGLAGLKTDNGPDLGLYGVELDTRYAVSKQLMLLGNYTFQQLDTGSLLKTNTGMSPPKHKFMLGSRYSPYDDLHLSAHLYYVDHVVAKTASNPIMDTRIRQYFRLDLRAEHEFWKKQASFAVGVSNLLDPGHVEGGSSAMDTGEVPRMVYAEMRVSFK